MIVGKLYIAERHHHIAFSSQELLDLALGCGWKTVFLTENAMSDVAHSARGAFGEFEEPIFEIRKGTTIVALETTMHGRVKVLTGEGCVCWLQNVDVWTAAFRAVLT